MTTTQPATDRLGVPDVGAPLSEPIGEHLAAICAAARAHDAEGALVAARDLRAEDRAPTLVALKSVAPLFGADPQRVNWTVVGRGTGPRLAKMPFFVATAELADEPEQLARILLHLWSDADLEGFDQVRSIVGQRPGAWRSALGRALASWGVSALWRAARMLSLEGLVPPPAEVRPVVVLGIPWRALPDARRADPLVGQLLDRLWTTPDAGRALGGTYEASMVGRAPLEISADRSTHTAAEWAGLFEAWGVNDPDRRPAALDGCLAALAGAAGDRRSDLRGWALVHGRLQVSEDEAAARQAGYLALAAGGAAPAAGVGRGELRRLLAAGRLDPDGLLETAPDALLRPEKGAVQEFLGLLDAAVRGGHVNPAACVEVVRPTLPHLPRGVDSKADKLMAAWGAAPRVATAELWTPPAPVGLPDRQAVEPVTSTDDLVDLLMRVLHDDADPVDLERAVDGLMRLRDPSPGVGAELRRAFRSNPSSAAGGLTGLVSSWLGYHPEPYHYGRSTRMYRVYDEASVPAGVQVLHEERSLWSWNGADGQAGQRVRHSWSWQHDVTTWVPSHLVGARLQELQSLVVGTPVGSLALPNANHGGIDGDVLLERLRARVSAGHPPGRRELAAALQRLDPADHAAVLASGALPEPAAAWLRMLSESQVFQQVVAKPLKHLYDTQSAVGPLVLWVPGEEGPAADGDDPVALWLDTSTVVGCWTDHHTGQYSGGELSAWQLAMPWHPDVVAVHAQPEVVSGNEQPDADLTGLLSLVAGRRVRLGPPATDLLCWAGTYRSVRTRTAAAEAIAAAARRGVLDGAELGRGVLRLVGPDAGPFLKSTFHLEPEPPKLSRIASTLADASRVDEHGERAVLDAVVASLPELRQMRGGVALLEIGAAIAERRGVRVDLPEPLASLAAGRVRSRLAEEARRLSGVGRTAVAWESVRPH